MPQIGTSVVPSPYSGKTHRWLLTHLGILRLSKMVLILHCLYIMCLPVFPVWKGRQSFHTTNKNIVIYYIQNIFLNCVFHFLLMLLKASFCSPFYFCLFLVLYDYQWYFIFQIFWLPSLYWFFYVCLAFSLV